MRHATWQRVERSPALHGLYRSYRKLPEGLRGVLRTLAAPHWRLAVWVVKRASRDRVVAGPFKGMELSLSPLSYRHLPGYILGTYEVEIADVVARIGDRGYRTILNIGAADGYYAVGLALLSPASRVLAFEAQPELHPTILSTVAKNRLTWQVSIWGRCELHDLKRELDAAVAPALLVVDIEGGELSLLDPQAVPVLKSADLLVETHDAFVPGCTETIIARFRETHAISEYTARPRVFSDFPADFLPRLARRYRRLAVDLMDERRPASQQWLYLTSKVRGRGVGEIKL